MLYKAIQASVSRMADNPSKLAAKLREQAGGLVKYGTDEPIDVWLTALHCALTWGQGDTALGIEELIEHYERQGLTHVAVRQPWVNTTPRDHGYRRVYASKAGVK